MCSVPVSPKGYSKTTIPSSSSRFETSITSNAFASGRASPARTSRESAVESGKRSPSGANSESGNGSIPRAYPSHTFTRGHARYPLGTARQLSRAPSSRVEHHVLPSLVREARGATRRGSSHVLVIVSGVLSKTSVGAPALRGTSRWISRDDVHPKLVHRSSSLSQWKLTASAVRRPRRSGPTTAPLFRVEVAAGRTRVPSKTRAEGFGGLLARCASQNDRRRRRTRSP